MGTHFPLGLPKQLFPFVDFCLFLEWNLFLKLSNPSLALNYTVLDHLPSFHFKLSYDGFTFSWITLELIGMNFLD